MVPFSIPQNAQTRSTSARNRCVAAPDADATCPSRITMTNSRRSRVAKWKISTTVRMKPMAIQ
jgi:hypothetical protein